MESKSSDARVPSAAVIGPIRAPSTARPFSLRTTGARVTSSPFSGTLVPGRLESGRFARFGVKFASPNTTMMPDMPAHKIRKILIHE
jgi:hypothetical protein